MALPFGTGFSPLRGEPVMGTVPIVDVAITSATLTTAGGARTATIAELLGGLFILNVDDAQTLTLPTGALLNAGLPGAKGSASGGSSFEFNIINTGDATLTVAVGTGGSLVVGNSKSSVATVTSNSAATFRIVVTGVLQAGDASDSYTVYRVGIDASAIS